MSDEDSVNICAVGLLVRLERMSVSRNTLKSLPTSLGSIRSVSHSLLKAIVCLYTSDTDSSRKYLQSSFASCDVCFKGGCS